VSRFGNIKRNFISWVIEAQHSLPGVTPGGLQSMPVPALRGPHYCRGGRVRPRIRTVGDLLLAWHVIQGVVAQQLPHPLIPTNYSNAEN
jgi:hypothetical protein